MLLYNPKTMKKQTIWVIGCVLLVAFLGLLAIQVAYLNEIVGTREEQFDEAVKRALFNTQRQLERKETQAYITKYYDDDEQQMLQQMSKSAGRAFVKSFGVNGLSLDADSLVKQKPRAARRLEGMMNRQQVMQEMLLGQYMYQRNVLDDVVFRIISQSNGQPVMERLDIEFLRQTFTEELQSAGYNLDYEFTVIDRDGSVGYKSAGYRQEVADREGSYMQALFPKGQLADVDPRSLTAASSSGSMPSRISYLEVYFPARRSFLLRTGLHFLIPSLVFTLAMLIAFIYVIWIVFRQKKLSEMKNDFINNMTHEFKTPISSISLASQMLCDPTVSKSPDMVKHITGVIADETKRLRFQVEKVLQMSMFDRQKTNLKLQEIPVNALVESATQTFRLKVEKAGGAIETHLDAEDDICMVDEMHFGNVVFNLMDNAYKYAKVDIPLHLSISSRNPDNDHLELRIADNGIGIKKEDLKRIFEKFYRVPTGNLHNTKGFGLGLAYVSKIVRDHGGEIRAESVYGQGTTFVLVMPLLKA